MIQVEIYFDIEKVINIYKNSQETKKLNHKIQLFQNDALILIGDHGSGKTTYLKILSNLIIVSENNLSNSCRKILKKQKNLLKKIEIESNEETFFPYLTVKEHISLFYSLIKSTNKEECIPFNKLTRYFELGKFQNLFPYQLSHGMKKALSLACIFIGNPKIILLDNPTAGMDLIMRKSILEKIKEIK